MCEGVPEGLLCSWAGLCERQCVWQPLGSIAPIASGIKFVPPIHLLLKDRIGKPCPCISWAAGDRMRTGMGVVMPQLGNQHVAKASQKFV